MVRKILRAENCNSSAKIENHIHIFVFDQKSIYMDERDMVYSILADVIALEAIN